MYIGSNVIHKLWNIRGVLCLEIIIFYRDLAQSVTCCILFLDYSVLGRIAHLIHVFFLD